MSRLKVFVYIPMYFFIYIIKHAINVVNIIRLPKSATNFLLGLSRSPDGAILRETARKMESAKNAVSCLVRAILTSLCLSEGGFWIGLSQRPDSS